eukprot:PhM_4_TR8290/c1_g1_i1/m.40593
MGCATSNATSTTDKNDTTAATTTTTTMANNNNNNKSAVESPPKGGQATRERSTSKDRTYTTATVSDSSPDAVPGPGAGQASPTKAKVISPTHQFASRNNPPSPPASGSRQVTTTKTTTSTGVRNDAVLVDMIEMVGSSDSQTASKSSTVTPPAASNKSPSTHFLRNQQNPDDLGPLYGMSYLTELGRGCHGRASLCVLCDTGDAYVVKDVRRSAIQKLQCLGSTNATESGIRSLQRELYILRETTHPNILNVHNVVDDAVADRMYVVSKLCEGGPVSMVLTSMTAEQLRYYLFDVLQGLLFLHKNGIYHRNVKPQNMMLCPNLDGETLTTKKKKSSLRTTRRTQCRLTDIGSTHQLPSEVRDVLHTASPTASGAEVDATATLSLSTSAGINCGCGIATCGVMQAVAYKAPELIRGSENVDEAKCDVWALGVSAYRMVFRGKFPFKGETMDDICRSILNDPMAMDDTADPIDPDADLFDFLAATLEKRPENRPTVQSLLEHPYFETLVGELVGSDHMEVKEPSASDLADVLYRGKNVDLSRYPNLTIGVEQSLQTFLTPAVPYLRYILVCRKNEGFNITSEAIRLVLPRLVRDIERNNGTITEKSTDTPEPSGLEVKCSLCLRVVTQGFFTCTVCEDVNFCVKCRYCDTGHDPTHALCFAELTVKMTRQVQFRAATPTTVATDSPDTDSLSQTQEVAVEWEVDIFQPSTFDTSNNNEVHRASATWDKIKRKSTMVSGGSFSAAPRSLSVVLTERDELCIEVCNQTTHKMFQPRKSFAQPQPMDSSFMQSSRGLLSGPGSRKKLLLPTEAEVRGTEDEDDVQELIQENAARQDLELVLEYCNLEVVPEGVLALSHLVILHLEHNNLGDLDDDVFAPLLALERLFLGSNGMSRLPKSVCQLHNLTVLDANTNHLSQLPDGFHELENLEILALDFNNFTEMPDVTLCRDLVKLFILNNLNLRDVRPDALLAVSSDSPLQMAMDNHPSLVQQMSDPRLAHIEVMWNRIYADAILPGKLLLGSLRTAQNSTTLQQSNVTHILTVGRDLATPEWTVPIVQKRVQVDDNEGSNLRQHFADIIGFIDDAISGGGTVLVHCFAGMSRSATVTIAFLMMRRGMRLDEAYRLVKERRPAIHPNEGFLRQLIALDAEIYGTTCSDNNNNNNQNSAGVRPLDLASLNRHIVP